MYRIKYNSTFRTSTIIVHQNICSFSYLIKVKKQDDISSLGSVLKCIVYVCDRLNLINALSMLILISKHMQKF